MRNVFGREALQNAMMGRMIESETRRHEEAKRMDGIMRPWLAGLAEVLPLRVVLPSPGNLIAEEKAWEWEVLLVSDSGGAVAQVRVQVGFNRDDVPAFVVKVGFTKDRALTGEHDLREVRALLTEYVEETVTGSFPYGWWEMGCLGE